MRDWVKSMNDDDIIALLTAARPSKAVPEGTDCIIRNIIRNNTTIHKAVPEKHRVSIFEVLRPYNAVLAAGAVIFAGITSLWFFNEKIEMMKSSPVASAVSPEYLFGNVITVSKNGASSRLGQLSNISENDTIITGSKSGCLLTVDKNTRIYLGENTNATFTKYDIHDKNQISISLQTGRIAATVNKLSKGSYFEVVSPALTASVRGTEFMVSAVKGEKAYTAVKEGQVKVALTENPDVSIIASDREKAVIGESSLKIKKVAVNDFEFISNVNLAQKGIRTKDYMYFTADKPSRDLIGADIDGYKNESAMNNTIPSAKINNTRQTNEEFTTIERTYSVDADYKWQDSEIRIEPGDKVTITASGKVSTAKGSPPVGPEGGSVQDQLCKRECGEAPYGALIMSPDDGKTYIYAGSHYSYTASVGCTINFRVNDCDDSINDNRGSFDVVVKIIRKRPL